MKDGLPYDRQFNHLVAAAAAYQKISLNSERHTMAAGAKEDLRAIWAKISYWRVTSADEDLVYDNDGEGGGLEGLEAAIDMTGEEFLREVALQNGYEDSEDDGEESEDREEESEDDSNKEGEDDPE